MSNWRRGGMSLLCSVLASLGARDAYACGGGFSPPAEIESTVVSDHRMVFSLGAQQTVLWDQIRYTGNPSDFAWVLPVRPGTTIQLSHDEWIASLDAVTQPQIVQPTRSTFDGDGESGGGVGCGGGGSDNASLAEPNSGAGAAPVVQVVSEAVVGPYESVIVRSDQPQALETWLTSHGFAVPPALEPTIAAYTEAKMDFAALRLRPGQGVQAMQPVRIVSPGADASLPLRMVQAGVGSHVGLTLFVISEGRYRPMNFPEAVIRDLDLKWDESAGKSNYQDLSVSIMAQAGSTTWLTEYAGTPYTDGSVPSGSSTLYDAYYGSCYSKSADPVADASTGDDAGDAGTPTTAPTVTVPAAVCSSATDACCQFDDLELALSGLHRADVWVTRIRADLPAAALNADLLLEAHPSQVAVNNVHYAQFPDGTGAQIAPMRKKLPFGTGLVIFGTMGVVIRVMRRRRRTA